MMQGNALSRATPEQTKADLISSYVEKFACIAGREVTPQMYAVYIEALEGIDVRILRKGLKRCLEEATRFPWPGDVREACEEEV